MAANKETSGRSRTPSPGLPNRPDCQLGLALPEQLPPTTPPVDGAPLEQPLGPPPAETTVRKFAPLALLQKPLLPKVCAKPLNEAMSWLAHESFHGISLMYDLA